MPRVVPEKLRQILIPSRLSTHRDAALFSGSSVLRTAAQFAASLVTVRFVAPEDLGLWNTVSLATTYALLLQGGIINGLSRELPFHLGADRGEEAAGLAGTAQSFTAAGCVVALAGGAIALPFFAGKGPALPLSIVAVSLITAMTFYQNYLLVTFRSNQSFLRLSKVQAWNAALAILTIPALALWRYEGMVVRIVLITLAMVWMLHEVRPMKVRLLWDWKAFRTLMAVGVPIFALSYINSAAGTVDRVILLGVGGVKQVGYYSLALYIWQAFTVVPLSLSTYVYPRMSYMWGKTGDPAALWKGNWQTALVVLAIMAPMALVGWIALPLVGPTFFPNYSEGIFAAQLTLVSAVFYGAIIGANALWSMKAWKYMVSYQMSASALLVVGPFLGARIFSNPLTGVAAGMLFARVGGFAIGMVATYLGTRSHSGVTRLSGEGGGDRNG